MPDYAWTCHACHTANIPGVDQCTKCGCPAIAAASEVQRFVTTETAPPVLPQKPVTSGLLLGFILFGLFLLGGAIYQAFYLEWFPLFPIQIDGIFAIFKSMFGRNAGIYVSSLLAAALGLGCIWLGSIGFLRRKMANPSVNTDAAR